jgi:oligopeptide transport system substrate-binding protein
LTQTNKGGIILRKPLALLLILLMILTSFSGCAKAVDPSASSEATSEATEVSVAPATDVPQILNWNFGSEPKTLDPGLNSAMDSASVINNLYEGLFRNVDNQIIPGIAERYELSEDLLTYTIKLKPTNWSDGKPLTANDFVYSWKRAMDPVTASEYAFQMFYIKGAQEFYNGTVTADAVGVKAIDDLTLEVTLIAPTAYFVDLLTFWTYFPVREDAVAKGSDGSWALDPNSVISNGPFMMTAYNQGESIILEKNENYWNAENVWLDKLVCTMIVDESTMLTAYESGELDIIDSVPSAEIPRLQAEDPTFAIKPLLGTYYYMFNVTKAPVDNPKVRRALTLAIDRTAIVESVAKGGQFPAMAFVPPGLYDADGNEFRAVNGNFGIPADTSGTEEAKRLLAEAGYPEGAGFPTMEILYNTSEGHKAIAEVIQEMWKKNLNINVTISNQDWAVFLDTRHQGNFTVARHGWTADYVDPMTFLDLWTSYSGNNDAQWENLAYDALIEASKLMTGQERFEKLYEAEKMLMEDNILCPIYYYTDPLMVKATVQNWEKTALGVFFFGSTRKTSE